MRFITLGHISGVGKDTCGELLETLLKDRDVSCVRGGFADKLKAQAHDLYSWAGLMPAKYYNTRREDRYKKLPDIDLTPVEVWVRHGEAARRVYPHVWSTYLIRTMKATKARVGIITDHRIQDERRVLPEDTIYINVVRPGKVPIKGGIDEQLLGFPWTYTVNNEGVIRDLVEPLRAILIRERLISG